MRTKIVELLPVVVQELSILAGAWVWQVDQLQHERAFRDDAGSSGQEILAHHRLQHRTLPGTLQQHGGSWGQLWHWLRTTPISTQWL